MVSSRDNTFASSDFHTGPSCVIRRLSALYQLQCKCMTPQNIASMIVTDIRWYEYKTLVFRQYWFSIQTQILCLTYKQVNIILQVYPVQLQTPNMYQGS